MAIAYIGAGQGFENPSSGTVDYSVTTSGSDRMLVVQGFDNANGNCTGITYNGVALTQVVADYLVTGSTYLYTYTLVAPSTGANTVSHTYASSTALATGIGLAYSGVNQSNPTNTTSNKATSVNTITTSLTVSANSWLVGQARAGSSGSTTGGAGTTQRQDVSGITQAYDSNTALAAGSRSLIADSGSTESTFGFQMIELLEAVAASSIKSVNGLAKASIKSWNGVVLE